MRTDADDLRGFLFAGAKERLGDIGQTEVAPGRELASLAR